MEEAIELSLRLPGEWENCGAILMSWPDIETDWAYMLPEIHECYREMIKAFTAKVPVILIVHSIDVFEQEWGDTRPQNLKLIEAKYNDTWTRDYGPISVESSQGIVACDFKFNGWGLKFASCHDNLVTCHLFESNSLGGLYMNCLNFVLEGGSIESDGNGTILTTSRCLLSPNRNGASGREEIEDVLKNTLGAGRVLWLDHGFLSGDDTDSHIDTLARFALDNTIVYVNSNNPSDEHFHELKAMEAELRKLRTVKDEPYRLLPLPLPAAIYDEDGERLPATYANYLVIPGTVFMPVYGDITSQKEAKDNLSKAFPGYDIIEIDCRPLICQHGSLHCATMQLPSEIINPDLL